MRLTRANNKAIEYACKKFHYAKAVPVNPLGYNIYNAKDEWCGVVLFGYGANLNMSKTYGLQQGDCVELTRVALNGKQEATSQAVAMALRQLKKDCPLVRLVVSYADMDQEHIGTIYQATNWIYTGQTSEGEVKFIIKGKKVHKKTIESHTIIENGKKKPCPQTLEYVRKYFDPNATEFRTKGKRKYLMPFDKKMRKQVLPLAQPYPKESADWVKIDRSQFKTKADGTEGG